MKNLFNIVKNYGSLYETSKFKEIKETMTINEDTGNPNIASSTAEKNTAVIGKIGNANEFIKKQPAEMRTKISGAIKRLGDISGAEETKIAFYQISGRNVKMEFKPYLATNEPNAKQAMFTFVENSNRAEDIADQMYQATAGMMGTDEDVVFSIPAGIRAYSESLGKDVYKEMLAVFDAYNNKHKTVMIQDIISDMDSAATVNGRAMLYATFLINENGVLDPVKTGAGFCNNFLKINRVDPANTNGIADMISGDFSMFDHQIFILHCPSSVLTRIHYVLKSKGVDLFSGITSGVKGDLKMAYKYKFQSANILTKDSTYSKIFAIIANGFGVKNLVTL